LQFDDNPSTGAEVAEATAKCLGAAKNSRKDGGLECLEISSFTVGEGGIRLVSDALNRNNKLKEFQFTDRLGLAGLESIAETLRCNTVCQKIMCGGYGVEKIHLGDNVGSGEHSSVRSEIKV